ncbi:MAG TPA: hypothetical protein VJB41_02545 [Patescibacteria group bacterium]|nr:hypothetical protein [Patescibacteria group bacterium]
MSDNLQTLLNHYNPPEAPDNLFNKIIMRINRRQRMLAISRVIVFSFSLLGSLVAAWPIFSAVKIEFVNSGFLQFLSLAFSDFEVIITYWQSFISTLLESLPAISIALSLLIIFIFMGSLRFLTKDIKILINKNILAN